MAMHGYMLLTWPPLVLETGEASGVPAFPQAGTTADSSPLVTLSWRRDAASIYTGAAIPNRENSSKLDVPIS